MKKILAIIFACLSIFTIKSEYLVYKKVGDSIKLPTHDEHEKEIYPTLMKYQFPMCTNPLNNVHPEEIDASERDFLEYKLKIFNHSYCVAFVPTVLYELFILEKYTDRTLDLWAESIIEFFLKHLKEETDITVEDFNDQMKKSFHPLTTILSDEEFKNIKVALANKAVVFNFYNDEGDKKEQYELINKIYTEILLPHLHILSQMGALHGGMNALGDFRSSAHRRSPLTTSLPRPLKTITQIYNDQELYKDALLLNRHKNVADGHYAINKELGALIVNYLDKSGDKLQLPFLGAKKTLKLIRKKIANNLKNPKHHIIISSHSLDSIEEKAEYTPTSHDPRSFWFVRKPYESIHVRTPYHILEDLNTKQAKLLLNATLESEYSSEKNDDFNIYRAEKIFTLDDKKYILMPYKDKRPHSLSFGVSLFAGFGGDRGATTFYLSKNRNICITLAIPKRDYHKDFVQDDNVIFIPPYNTIVELAGGVGELFHARSKLPNVEHDYHISGICHKSNDAIEDLYVHKDDKEGILSKLSTLFKNKLTFLKSSDSISLRDQEIEEELHVGRTPSSF
ncbi:TPA: hypothetical protein DIC20_03375 [Candidatus Dependentiae bacterium]|nr:MAG: hypothetical protein US03_C0001G0065 [candidate division TM6 bacterium GW2011_GWF2_36_131]KKQ03799.1 MAG: hypothetical protein US13_C0001G0139 [candidate division TM6 bacterium GW2011_GWE2_36_25]KKQ19945.1 MAG: hypothetical protein US32_C0003G0062 [candidate division TM6 bacterium GW2011_GWA2_36_9]HBR70567.1 hypothetical protein [Candidatus Dependentiae bacterium]HCU00717.1 hypothetical protein [Candidatus Dependentiae bacterium]